MNQMVESFEKYVFPKMIVKTLARDKITVPYELEG